MICKYICYRHTDCHAHGITEVTEVSCSTDEPLIEVPSRLLCQQDVISKPNVETLTSASSKGPFDWTYGQRAATNL